jgi:class 3 adenylate cyclase
MGLWTLAGSMVLFMAVARGELTAALPLCPLMGHTSNLPVTSEPLFARTVLMGVLVMSLLAFSLSNFVANQSVRLHRHITESVLQRYLPPVLVERVAQARLRLDKPHERLIVTVLFTDLVGFIPLTGRLGPDAIGSVLNTHLGEVADVAHQHGATVDKFIGDCVMMIFGAPEHMAPDEQARKAAIIACSIHRSVAEIEGLEPLQARTGVNTGEAVVGNFESINRSDYPSWGRR